MLTWKTEPRRLEVITDYDLVHYKQQNNHLTNTVSLGKEWKGTFYNSTSDAKDMLSKLM